MNTQEYNECVRLHADSMYRYAVSVTHDSVKAEDAVQNVFAKLWQKREQVNMQIAKSYLLKSVYRACIDLYRTENAQSRVREKAEVVTVQSSTEEQYEMQQMIQLALARVNDKQRQIIMMRDYEGYAYKDIGEMMDMTESQVKINIFRARKKLQQVLIDLGYRPAKINS